MRQVQMKQLLDVNDRTLRNWKNGNRTKLYTLLEKLDYDMAKQLLSDSDQLTYMKVLENEKYFENQLDFETYLYPLLLRTDKIKWKEFAENDSLSNLARIRAAYLYTYLAKKPLNIKLKTTQHSGFFHKNTTKDGDGFAHYFGLLNGLDNRRFNQYKNTGSF